MESREQPRKFPPWKVSSTNAETMVVSDSNGVPVAWIFHRDDTRKFGYGNSKLSPDEASRIAKAIARIPEFMSQRRGFYQRGRPAAAVHFRPDRPYHVALEDSYISARWDEINELCRLNSLPFNATGEKIRDGGLWCVYEFTWQMDAILFWAAFEGRWLRGSEFHYPERPSNLPKLQPLQNWPKFDPKKARS